MLSNFRVHLWGAWILGVVGIAFGGLITWSAVRSLPASVIYFEHGAHRRWLWRTHTLRYEDTVSVYYARGVVGQARQLGTQLQLVGPEGETFWTDTGYTGRDAEAATGPTPQREASKTPRRRPTGRHRHVQRRALPEVQAGSGGGRVLADEAVEVEELSRLGRGAGRQASRSARGGPEATG